VAPSGSPYSIVIWRDVFVLVDTGRAPFVAYELMTRRILALASAYPQGIALLIIVPEDATPPSEEARRGIEQAIAQTKEVVRCLCWLVEGKGFQAGMARAVLNGIRLFRRYEYPTNVSVSLQQSLAWLLPHLAGGVGRLADVPIAMHLITRERGHEGLPKAV
jgi:hypothetical protein